MSLGHEWDMYYLGLARYAARKSKDPSTKCGCVLARPDKRPISIGFNGFPQRLYDSESLLNDREEKYKRIIHAEMNALIFAKSDLSGAICYTWPFAPCDRCAVMLIQAGIEAAVFPWLLNGPEVYAYTTNPGFWAKSQEAVTELFLSARVATKAYPMTLVQKETM